MLFKFSLIIFLVLIFLFKTDIDYYDILFVIFALLNLISSFKKFDSDFSKLLDYFFWITAIFFTQDVIILDDIAIFLITLKVLLLVISYLRFKKFSVPSTVLGKIWLITMFLYLSEVMLNSTHGFKSICLFLGIISTIENIAIVMLLKQWRKKVSSIAVINKVVI